MAVISRTNRYLFIHSPRTGGTALTKSVLVPQLDGKVIPAKPIEVANRGKGMRTVRQHATRAHLIESGQLTEDVANDLLTFTTVRNPFDSLVSGYVKRSGAAVGRSWTTRNEIVRARMAMAAEHSFPEYIELKFGHKRRSRHLYAPQIDGADHIMRFEHLQEDFDEVLRMLGIDRRIEIGRINSTSGRSAEYQSYYTPETRAIVERVFAVDLERFGYSFEGSSC